MEHRQRVSLSHHASRGRRHHDAALEGEHRRERSQRHYRTEDSAIRTRPGPAEDRRDMLLRTPELPAKAPLIAVVAAGVLAVNALLHAAPIPPDLRTAEGRR
jgi:hypothetical protein